MASFCLLLVEKVGFVMQLMLDIMDWKGWGALGTVVSVCGFILAIYYARLASKNSLSAKEAANEAKRTISLVDAIHELGIVGRMLNEISLRIDADRWDAVAEICGQIRSSIAGVTSSANFVCSKNVSGQLSGIQSQIVTVHNKAYKIQHNNEEPDKASIKSALSKQSEKISTILAEIKNNVENDYVQ